MITLYKSNGSWMAQFTDPQVKDLFGTDTIPTAFTDRASAAVVRREIESSNPDEQVIIRD